MKNKIDLLREWKREELENGIRFVFPAPEGAGIRPWGFDVINERAEDVMGWYGFRLCLVTEKPDVHFTVRAGFYGGERLLTEFCLAEPGEHRRDLSLKDFPAERVRENVWRELIWLEITALSGAAGKTAMPVASALLLRGSRIALETESLGRSGEAGEWVEYTVTVHNCLECRQWVEASQVIEGWESMYARITPERFVLEPGGFRQVHVSVQVHENMPRGAHEKTIVGFLPEGDSAGAREIAFWTLRRLEHPYIYHTAEKWRETAEKIRRESVFTPGYEKLRQDAENWQVPHLVPFGERDYCCDTQQEHYIMCCAYLYSITGERRYAEKIAAFFRYFSDPDTGYPARKKGCSQSYVQEGHFFQHLALAYDMIYNAEVMCSEEHRRVEVCFRIYMEILDKHIRSGHISNWTLSELTGAVYCAMVLQDFERMDRFLFGPCGSFDQLCHGTFSDGWWYECSVGYNIWVSSMFLHTAHALLPFGINLIHYQFPLSFGKEVDSIGKGQTRQIRHGMYNEKWGGMEKGYICIKDLFDAVVPFLDYRGVLFGINDSDEKKIEGVHFGSTFDLAYTHYRDPAYIPIIRRFDTVDPVFGHAELGEAQPVKAGKKQPGETCGSAYADNIGIAMLRSRPKADGPASEHPGMERSWDARQKAARSGEAYGSGQQIQAVLRYGSHGFAHGHYDRTELLSVMRYGRSFFNPEHLWWGYGHFMYKFYVQNSNTKNMVVVDGKMQIPADARRVLFYSGKGLQAAGVRTESRWGYPPFGGMIYREGESLQERCRYNACDLPSCDAAPYGEITQITEPIRQTRVMAVLDDCIVLFDSLEGEREHRYESLMQIKGFRSLSPAGETGSVLLECHTGKKDQDPRSDEQFITDCFWYRAQGETAARFETRFGPGEDLRGTRSRYNEPGSLHMDVYTAWPHETRQCLGLAAEDLGQRSPCELRIKEDGNCRESFCANPWLLEARRLELALDPDSRTLTLEIRNKPLYTEQGYPYESPQCLFLADAFLLLENGEKLSLSGLPAKSRNIDGGMGIGRDYEGGRVLIEGEEYSDAIPISTQDHGQWGILEYDLSRLRAVGFTALAGVDNFPGDEDQRRRTYGVAQQAVKGRFITVIEPHEGSRRIASVEGLSKDRVRIYFQDGSRQEVWVEDLEGVPKCACRLWRQDGTVEQEETV